MSWFSIGPDFTFAPRDGNFKRLSRRNEVGRQGLVSNVIRPQYRGLEEGSEYRFEVQQTVNKQVVGGSTYVVQIAGVRKAQPPHIPESLRLDLDVKEINRIEKEAEPYKYLPPWAEDIVDARETEPGKQV
jgi:hypothetical protein